MQAHRDRVGANLPPLARVTTGADVLDVDGAFDDQPGAERRLARLDHALEQRLGPVGTEHLIEIEVGAGALHRLPAGGFGEERSG